MAWASIELSMKMGDELGVKVAKKETFLKCFFVHLGVSKKSCQKVLYYIDNKEVIRARGRNKTSK